MFGWLRCRLGSHDWTRIGSAPAELITYRNGTHPEDSADRRPGFMLLLECMRCGYELGCGEFTDKKVWHSAGYARTYIEESERGRIRKGDR